MAIIYVDASRPNDTGDGLSEGAAKRTIRAARNIAANGDTIKIKRGYCYEPTNGYFFPALTSFNGGSLTITDYGSGDLPIWDGLTYEPASAADWTYVAGSGGVWKKVFAAWYVRRVFADSSSGGILIADRAIGAGLRRCPVGTPAITSIAQNESEANIVAALQSFQFNAPWAPGGATTSYALYMWTGSDSIQPPDYFNGLAFVQANGSSVGSISGIEIQDMDGVLVENQHFRGIVTAGVAIYADNADAGDTNDIVIQDCDVTHFWGYGIRVRRTSELAPTWVAKNGVLRRLNVDTYYRADEQELTQGEAVMSAWDGIQFNNGTDTWLVEDCVITDAGHGAMSVDGSASSLSVPRNITFRDNTCVFNGSHSYARGLLSINCSGVVFSQNTITNQNVRSQVAGETTVDGNIWENCRTSIRKSGTDQWIACESYYYDNESGLGDSVRYIPVWPTNVQIINNRVSGSFTTELVNLMSYDSSYGTPLWPANSVEFRNNSCVSDVAPVLLLQSNGSTNAADISEPVFANNVFYAPSAAGTNRVRWNATAASPLTNYTLSTAPGFSGTLETNPMADTKISALSDGAAVQATDNVPAVRGPNNVRVQIDLSDKVVGAASSVDNEIALFSGTGGKTLKRATTTGVLKASSGVITAATADTDYATPAVSKFLAEGTWANIPSAASNSGRIYPCTDIGNCGLVFLVSDGTTWRLMGPTNLFWTSEPQVAAATCASETVFWASSAFPAGFLTKMRYFAIHSASEKSATTEQGTIRFRMGTTGTTSDTLIRTHASGTAWTSRQFFAPAAWMPTSATNIRTVAWREGGFYVPGQFGAAYPENATVSSMDANAFYMALTCQSNGSSETFSIPHVHVIGY